MQSPILPGLIGLITLLAASTVPGQATPDRHTGLSQRSLLPVQVAQSLPASPASTVAIALFITPVGLTPINSVTLVNQSPAHAVPATNLIAIEMIVTPQTNVFDRWFNALLRHRLDKTTALPVSGILLYYNDDSTPIQQVTLEGLLPQRQSVNSHANPLTKTYIFRYTGIQTR